MSNAVIHLANRNTTMLPALDIGESALLTDLAMCVNYYRLFSPGLYCCAHATVQLDDATRFCPGLVVHSIGLDSSPW